MASHLKASMPTAAATRKPAIVPRPLVQWLRDHEADVRGVDVRLDGDDESATGDADSSALQNVNIRR